MPLPQEKTNVIPADILYEDDDVLAFRDINPQAPLHFLVIPKKQIATINDITPDDYTIVGKLSGIAALIVAEHGEADKGFRTVMNCNEYGGQEKSPKPLFLPRLQGKSAETPIQPFSFDSYESRKTVRSACVQESSPP